LSSLRVHRTRRAIVVESNEALLSSEERSRKWMMKGKQQTMSPKLIP
jgi:hypothetical protein